MGKKITILKHFEEMKLSQSCSFTLFLMLHKRAALEKPEEFKNLHKSVRIAYKIEN